MKPLPADFFAGARAALPILLGVSPFAMICSVAGVSVGLTPFEAAGMSVVVFAGASQLAVLQLMQAGSPWLIMVLTAWIINLRFTMYSAALASFLQNLPTWKKVPLAYMLSDQAFGVSMARFAGNPPARPDWFFFGAAGIIWFTWQVSAVIGALLGTLVPASWGFDFAFPLSFMALMFGALRDRPAVVAALTAGVAAVLARGLPNNLWLVLAAVLGIAAGLLAETLARKNQE